MVKLNEIKRAAEMTAEEWGKRRFWRWRAAWMSVLEAYTADRMANMLTTLTQGDAIALFVPKQVMRDTLRMDIGDGEFDMVWMHMSDKDRKQLLGKANLPAFTTPGLVTRAVRDLVACQIRDAKYAQETAR